MTLSAEQLLRFMEEATAAVDAVKVREYQSGFVAGYRAAQAAMKADLKELLT